MAMFNSYVELIARDQRVINIILGEKKHIEKIMLQNNWGFFNKSK
jgi:hypothetical protein